MNQCTCGKCMFHDQLEETRLAYHQMMHEHYELEKAKKEYKKAQDNYHKLLLNWINLVGENE